MYAASRHRFERTQGTGSGLGSQPHSVASMRLIAAVIALVACVHVGCWALVRGQSPAADVDRPLASVSYGTNPRQPATDDQIRRDMKLLAPLTRAIRTYSSTGAEHVPAIADEFGLRATVGAWISKDPDAAPGSATCSLKDKSQNEREFRNAIDLVHKNHNVDGLIIGNETIYRDDCKVDDIIELIKRAKREVNVPVTTGEIYSVWLEHPELVSAVDYIAAHILPYWEGVSDKDTVYQAISVYDQLRHLYPGKRIVIAEFGWPSAGYNRRDANPGGIEQAVVLRNFIAEADALGIDYNIVEAIDQPWKTSEGSVGPYWGLFNNDREPKFAWSGPVSSADHWKLAGIAVLIGLLLSLPILTVAGATVPQAALMAIAVHVVGAWCATVFDFFNGHYFVPGAAFAFGLGLVLLVPLIIIALSRVEDVAAISFGRRPRRLLAPGLTAPEAFAPKVSIHIPAYREPPDMLKQTLDAVAQLNYPNYECVVVINNTPDPALWRPIEDHCRTLGDKFKFINVENLTGFKAGALRVALEHSAADAEIVGVIDADYVVHPDWLKDLVPAFAEPTVGLIQAPQDHRDGDRSLMHYAMCGEYAGFFDAGMVQRNEHNAIIVHGTMCLIRRSALEMAGGWSSATICEDTDLGLSILEDGWQAHYSNRRYGWGLLPDTYEAFKNQRHRWAYGGAQILRKHWRRFLPGASRLTGDQKQEFTVGWLNWLGAESVGVVVALLNLLWVPVVAFVGIAIPDKILTLPILVAFALSLLHFLVVYRLRVTIPLGQTLTAMFAAMSVQWTVAKAVCDGLIKYHLPFIRTAKGGRGRRPREFQAFWEAVIGGLMVVGAIVVIATNWERVREVNIFAGVLLVQSLPFLAAVAIALLEGSRINDLAFWRGVEARVVEMVRRRALAKTPAPADKSVETAP